LHARRDSAARVAIVPRFGESLPIAGAIDRESRSIAIRERARTRAPQQ
jgi:hypothetical protein